MGCRRQLILVLRGDSYKLPKTVELFWVLVVRETVFISRGVRTKVTERDQLDTLTGL